MAGCITQVGPAHSSSNRPETSQAEPKKLARRFNSNAAHAPAAEKDPALHELHAALLLPPEQVSTTSTRSGERWAEWKMDWEGGGVSEMERGFSSNIKRWRGLREGVSDRGRRRGRR